jgi:hypothetical protein
VRDIVDTSGNELDHIVYDSFGDIVTETNATNGGVRPVNCIFKVA